MMSNVLHGPRKRLLTLLVVLGGLLAALGVCTRAGAATLERPNSGQRAAALDYLNALASGDAQAIAFAIHPDDLHALRMRLLGVMEDESKRSESVLRARLFGPARPLDELEHLTDSGFFVALSERLYFPGGRTYSDTEGIAAVPDRNDTVQVIVRGKQPRERNSKTLVDNLVTLKAYGKDWKASLPSELEAQIEDLMHGRPPVATATRVSGQPHAPAPGTAAPAQPGITELLKRSEELLSNSRCDEYYNKEMSPNFRRITGKKALAALIASCQNSLGTREMLLATLHIVQGLTPRYEYEGQRAVYDLTGQGLPYDRFTVEEVDKRWYIAE